MTATPGWAILILIVLGREERSLSCKKEREEEKNMKLNITCQRYWNGCIHNVTKRILFQPTFIGLGQFTSVTERLWALSPPEKHLFLGQWFSTNVLGHTGCATPCPERALSSSETPFHHPFQASWQKSQLLQGLGSSTGEGSYSHSTFIARSQHLQLAQ